MQRLRSDWVLAAAVGLVALALYARTLYPGLVGDGDTPKFQYVGAVAGTPHNPGYPLYLVLSYAFSRLPFGNLALRINFMSAVFAALAVALLVRLLRALGCGPGVAAAVALAAGCGPVFWSQATLAEVYTVAAALLLGVLVALVLWSREPQRTGPLFAAAAIFALALGHHLTIVVLAPAIVAYVLLVDRRVVLRARVMWPVVALQLLGLCQYLLIIARTRRGASYLGSTARTLPELLDVMRATQFGNRLFVFDLATLVGVRVPEFARIFVRELSLAGVLLVLVGFALLARRRAPAGVLLGLGALGVVFFALNYKVDDTPVFLISAFLLAWAAAGVALQALADWLRARWAPAGAVLAAFLVLALPTYQLAAHWKASDHSQRTFEMRYFRALVETVPAGSVILAESYTVDQMLLYELLGEGYAERRGLKLAARDPESATVYANRGLAVFVFERTRQELAPLGFRFEPVVLVDDAGEPFNRRAFPLFRLVFVPGRDAG